MPRRTGGFVDNLPLHPTPFIGRGQEIAEISALFEKPDCRLLTLLGPGGVGKTRLDEWLLPNYPTQEIAGLTRMLARLNSVMPALAKAKDSGFKGVVADQRRQSPGGLQVRQHLTLWSNLVVRSDGGQSAVWN